MGKRIVIMGAGAVGGYAGGHMARSGEDITLVDPWPEHVEYINKNGINLKDANGEYTIPVKAMHLHEVQTMFKQPVDIAFICTKSYDTEWAAAMIKQYLTPEGFVVSLQNCINEECIARVVGWGKTVGCVVSAIGVELYKPGHIIRTIQPGGGSYTVFRVGEVHGRMTARVEELARMLSAVDSAKATTNLWGERWSKLVNNSMHNGLSAATGLGSREMVEMEAPRRLSIRLGGEAIGVGQALGYALEPVRGLSVEKLLAASRGDASAMEEIENTMLKMIKQRGESGRPSTGQDILKGRRTEIDFINGFIAAKGEEVGVPAPTHAAITSLVKSVERGEMKPIPENIANI